MFGARIETKEQSVFVLFSLVINMCSSCPFPPPLFFFFFLVQSWTERAKGQTGDAADLKKRKRAEGGGAENENGQAEADENSAKKKKSLDPSSKLAAFAFTKN